MYFEWYEKHSVDQCSVLTVIINLPHYHTQTASICIYLAAECIIVSVNRAQNKKTQLHRN